MQSVDGYFIYNLILILAKNEQVPEVSENHRTKWWRPEGKKCCWQTGRSACNFQVRYLPQFYWKLFNTTQIFRTTLPQVYKILCSTVVEAAKEACTDPEALTQIEGNKYKATISAWALISEALEKMMQIAKFHETKPLLSYLFKVS